MAEKVETSALVGDMKEKKSVKSDIRYFYLNNCKDGVANLNGGITCIEISADQCFLIYFF